MKMPTILPESFLRCLDADTRKSLGRAGMSADEAAAKCEIRNERQLQAMIVNLLRLRGIEPLWHRTDKRSAATIGWPDITFAVSHDGIENTERFPFNTGNLDSRADVLLNLCLACAWEVKFGDGELSIEQQQMFVRLSKQPNCWRVRVIRSVDEALAELKEIGL